MEVAALLGLSECGQLGDAKGGLGAVLAPDCQLDWSRALRWGSHRVVGEPWEHRQGPLAWGETGGPPWPKPGDPAHEADHVDAARDRDAIAAAAPSARHNGE